MNNPFYFGNEVYSDNLCNRVDELSELRQDALGGLNILLFAPRRFGKTSLLKKLQNDLQHDENTKVIFFDWFSVTTVEEFIEKYFHAIASAFESKNDEVVKLFKDLLQIRPNITMKISQAKKISYGLSFTKKELESTFEDIVNLPYQYAKKTDKKVIVIFDEFQEIEQFDIEKNLITIIQAHSIDVSYIFSGSKKSILNSMYNDKSRAFYKSAKYNIIKEIKLDDWIVFANEKFTKTDKFITNKQIERIYDLTDGFPYYMQQLLYLLWDIAQKSVQDEDIVKALKLMYEREYNLYAYIYSSLTPNQKITLKYIVEFGGRNLYSNENLAQTALSASTLKSTLESLMKKDICDRLGDKYYLVDPFMRYWLKEK
jgi:hypothetical protein